MAKAPLGVLLLHGLTSHLSTVEPVLPRLQKYDIPYRMPWLRGHGTQPSDLKGVKWQDWVADGQKAFDDLLNECEKVILIGFSMGSLVALNLALANPNKTAALICLAPALKARSKLALIAPLIARFKKTRKARIHPRAYFDPEQAKTNQNYKQMPTEALLQFLRFASYTRNAAHLSKISVPTLILATTQDRTIDYRMAQFLHDQIASRQKTLVWFHGTGHEMLRDAQREEVLDQIEKFIADLQATFLPKEVLVESK